MGNNSTSASLQPQNVLIQNGSSFSPLESIQQISVGDFHTCALKSGGGVLCWGSGEYGQLGVGDTPLRRQIPQKVRGVDGGVGFLTNIAQISAGGKHTCALKNNSRVLCWGSGSSGQLGNGLTLFKGTTPVEVLEPIGAGGRLKNISQISLGGKHTCALKNDGRVLCWGMGGPGQLGVGSTANSSRPIIVVATDESQGGSPMTNITQLSAGDQHTCSLNNANQVHCWGKGASKRLGQINNITNRPTPQRVKTDVANVYLSDVEQVGVGYKHSCALKIEWEPCLLG